MFVDQPGEVAVAESSLLRSVKANGEGVEAAEIARLFREVQSERRSEPGAAVATPTQRSGDLTAQVLAALLARATGFSRFPEGMDWKAMVGLGLLCGIGFTMSLFIASLAFGDDAGLFPSAVLGVLCASLVSALAGLAWLWATLPRAPAAAGHPPRAD